MERQHGWCSLGHFSPGGEWCGSGFNSPRWTGQSWRGLGSHDWACCPGRSVQQSVRSTAQCDACRHWIFACCANSHCIRLTQIWMDFAFACSPTWLFAVTDKGLITPILFQFNVVSLSNEKCHTVPLLGQELQTNTTCTNKQPKLCAKNSNWEQTLWQSHTRLTNSALVSCMQTASKRLIVLSQCSTLKTHLTLTNFSHTFEILTKKRGLRRGEKEETWKKEARQLVVPHQKTKMMGLQIKHWVIACQHFQSLIFVKVLSQTKKALFLRHSKCAQTNCQIESTRFFTFEKWHMFPKANWKNKKQDPKEQKKRSSWVFVAGW